MSKFSFCTLKSNFPEYVRGNRQLFYTFDEIMQHTCDKTKSGTIIFSNMKNLEF